MKAVREFLGRERLWPLFVVIAGILVLLPRLGAYGFWEPQEIKVADDARKRIERHTITEVNRAVAGYYKLRSGDLENPQNTIQIEARNVAIGLAGRFTRASAADLRQTFNLTNDELAKARSESTAQAEDQLADKIAAITALIDNTKNTRKETKPTGPPFTEWLVARGIDKVSGTEFGARLPLVLMALIALLATFYLGRRLGGARTGLIAALVLLSFPLFLFQARQLTSDIGAITGAAVMMLGIVGLAWPGREHRMWMYPVDISLVVGGALVTYYAAGALLGLVAPFAAAGSACLISLFADRSRATSGAPADSDRSWPHLLAIATVATSAAIVALVVVVTKVFDFTDPIPGGRAIFGKSMVATSGYVDALAGSWRPNGDLNATFDALFEQIAFGMFPWVALAPIAIVHISMGARSGRRNWAGYAMFAWAMFAWIVATVMFRKVGPVHYPALVAIAIGIALWIDELLTSRSRDDGDEAGDDRPAVMPLRLPLVALFVAAAALVLAKDMHAFANKITSIHILGSTVEYPADLKTKAGFLVFATLFTFTLAAGTWLWCRRRDKSSTISGRVTYYIGHYGIHAAVAVGLLFAIFLAQVWTPTLSRKLSSKHLFSVYHDRKADDDKLGIMGNHGSGPQYYAGDNYTQLANRKALLEFLKDEGRVFALVPASELCAVHRSAKEDFEYFVLDDSHARFLLMSNQLKNGERDHNPLARSILRSEPDNIARAVAANYDDKVELIGVNMPERVGRGDSFTMTLFFKVLKPVGGNWKIFVHFDGGGLRFQGDHKPINDRCGTGFWQPGDYIVDTFTVEAGDVTYAKTDYTARVGFFMGSHGNWKNMPVVKGEHDNNDRVPVGLLRVR